MFDAAIAIAIIAGALLLICLICLKYCPTDNLLIIRRRSSQNSGSDDLVRIARQRTWINPVNEKSELLDLQPFVVHAPVELSPHARQPHRFYIHLKLRVEVGDDEASLRKAAVPFAGLTGGARVRKLETLLIDHLQVPPEAVPQSARALTDRSLPGTSEWQSWLTAVLHNYGINLKTWEVMEISAQPTLRSGSESLAEESELSQSCRYLDFEPVPMEVSIPLNPRETFLGTVALEFFLTACPDDRFTEFLVACENFLDKSEEEVQSLLVEVLSPPVHASLEAADGFRLIDQLCHAFEKSGAGSISSAKTFAIHLLNAAADETQTWRGKLAMMRTCMTAANTVRKCASTLSQSSTSALSGYGVGLQRILFKDLDVQNSTLQLASQWHDEMPGGKVDTVNFETRLPISFDNRRLTAVLPAWVTIKLPTPESSVPADLAASLARNLHQALSSPKVDKLLSTGETLWQELSRDTDGTLDSAFDAAQYRLILPVIRLLMATLEAYGGVRHQFVKSCSKELSASGCTLGLFALTDFDLLDENSKSLFAVNARAPFAFPETV